MIVYLGTEGVFRTGGSSTNKLEIKHNNCVNLGLVWLSRESSKELENGESKGFCVIYIYPEPTSFLSSSHTFSEATNFIFPSLPNLPPLSIFTLSLSISSLSFLQPNGPKSC